MDLEVAQASGATQAVLGIMEFKVRALKKVGPATVCRRLVVRRQYRISDPVGPCADPEKRKELGLLGSMVHLNPVDLYRDIERTGP